MLQRSQNYRILKATEMNIVILTDRCNVSDCRQIIVCARASDPIDSDEIVCAQYHVIFSKSIQQFFVAIVAMNENARGSTRIEMAL